MRIRGSHNGVALEGLGYGPTLRVSGHSGSPLISRSSDGLTTHLRQNPSRNCPHRARLDTMKNDRPLPSYQDRLSQRPRRKAGVAKLRGANCIALSISDRRCVGFKRFNLRLTFCIDNSAITEIEGLIRYSQNTKIWQSSVSRTTSNLAHSVVAKPILETVRHEEILSSNLRPNYSHRVVLPTTFKADAEAKTPF